MCTIVLLSHVHPTYPLLVAANRDEFYSRESSGPAVLATDPLVVGGTDVKGGGTWLGANEHGLFAAITNQRTHTPPNPGLRSRGLVVRSVLQSDSPAAATALVEALDPAAYNSFNLVFGDANAVFVAYSRTRARTLEVMGVARGITVLPNDRIGSPDFPKSERAVELAKQVADQPWPALARHLAKLLGDHELPSIDKIPPLPPGSFLPASGLRQLQALCVHTRPYGTRSATIVALEPGRVTHYLYADGPPCSTPFRDYTHLISRSSRASSKNGLASRGEPT